jgi:hypothetical protein
MSVLYLYICDFTLAVSKMYDGISVSCHKGGHALKWQGVSTGNPAWHSRQRSRDVNTLCTAASALQTRPCFPSHTGENVVPYLRLHLLGFTYLWLSHV